jgi:hypothetical protein
VGVFDAAFHQLQLLSERLNEVVVLLKVLVGLSGQVLMLAVTYLD